MLPPCYSTTWIPFGQHRGKHLHEVSVEDLQRVRDWLADKPGFSRLFQDIKNHIIRREKETTR